MKHIKDTITKQYLSKLDTLNISIKSIIDNLYIGTRKSNKYGMSLEFSDFKEYNFGDDIRRIDWNSYARTDKTYIKRFREEKQATINIFIDSSKSMDYGEENKGYYAKLMAASITYVALKNGDTVNIFVCNNNINLRKENIKSKKMFVDTIKFLDDIKFEGEADLSSISQISAIKRGISFVLSDFFLENTYKIGIKTLQYNKQDIIMMHILSKQEISPKYNGNIRFIDSETKKSNDVTIDEHILQQYKIVFKEFKNGIKNFCADAGILYRLISTDSPVIQELGDTNKQSFD